MDRAANVEFERPFVARRDGAVDECPPLPSRLRAATPPEPISAGRYAPLPSGWMLDGGLRAFREELAHAGRSTAALKLVAVLAMSSTCARFAVPGSGSAAQITYDELHALAGLSRPLVIAAKKFLRAQGLLDVDKDASTGATIYRLAGRADATGSILHTTDLARAVTSASGVERLRRLSCRRADELRALKLYMLLSGLRREDAESVVTRLADIVLLSGMRDAQARHALAELRRRGLIEADLRALRACSETEPLALRTRPL